MAAALTARIPIKDKHGRTVGEREVATYAGLLARAHAEGLKRIATKLLQVPHPDNGDVAIASAEVEMRDGTTFTGIGDASPRNVPSRIAEATIRMAEARAKARALRDATDIGIVALEELADLVEHRDEEPPPGDGPLAPLVRKALAEAQAKATRNDVADERSDSTSPSMSEPQHRLLLRLLSERGIDGDAAESRLRELAGVDATTSVSRGVASKVIETLQRDRPAGGNGAAHR
ncbi:MAG: hypothetical protein HYS27_09670 [Deltaproteobacteria bacterium]|nr:hypothetical protein [Deltaproteobacteria bacterium]